VQRMSYGESASWICGVVQTLRCNKVPVRV